MSKKANNIVDYISLEYRDAFEIMMKSTADLIYFKDKESRYIYNSDAHIKCLNESDIKNVIGKTDFDFFAKEHAIEAQKTEQQIIKTGKSVLDVEEHATFANGEKIWFKVSRYPLYDKNKEIVGTWGISTDITKQKNTEFKIMESEEKFRYLFDNLPVGITLTLPTDELQANRTMCEMLGYTAEELKMKPWQSITHPDDIEKIQTERNALLSNEKSFMRFNKRFIRKDGNVLWVDLLSTIRYDAEGKPLYFISSFVDITEKMQAEVALHDSETRMRSITDSAYDAILMMDQNGEISYWNPAAERIFGYTSADAIGQNLNKLIIPSKYRKTFRVACLALKQHNDGAAAGKTLDFEAKRKDNKKIYVQLSLSAVQISSGEYSVGIIRDVTEQKKNETELLKAKEIAEEATGAKSEFLANMSHEIRTPMNAVIGFSGLIKKTDLTQKQSDYISKIDSSAKSLLGIINDILDFSKIEAGKLELEAVNFRLDDVINDTVNMLSDRAAEKNIEFINNISSDVPYALIGDPLRIGQILINLVNNAVKFTEKGHVLVKTELIKKDEASCQIKFSVNDTGIGLTEAQRNNLFSAFSQADTSVTRRFGGTGLGLTISKRLVEMMNGRIFVESEFGVGSTFSFIVDFLMQANVKSRKVFENEKLQNIKVLIVDDNEMSREILKEQLESFGINAAVVDSGRAAILELKKEVKKKPYDLVIMDWRMPEMDGIEAARIIIEDNEIEHTPMTIMISAFGREEIVKKAEKIGINTFLMKPINQSLLFDSIVNMFGLGKKDISFQSSDRENDDNIINRVDGIKVLLVEDNAINQEVATEILSSAGAAVEIAENGKEAVEAVNTSNYDIVLMDLQMPIMGGYEATQIIRRQEKHKELPIIAMTAHAMQGVKEECIAAGMNDYVSKPIDPRSLFSVIKKWVKKTVEESNIQSEKHSDIEIECLDAIQFPASIPGIDIEVGLDRLNGNKKLYKRLLIDFSKKYLSFPTDIRKAIEKNNLEEASRLAHTLKGVAGNISANDVQIIVAELELLFSKNDTENYDRLLDKLALSLESLNMHLSGLDTEIKIKQNAEEPINLIKVEPVLRDLALLVWEDNVDAEKSLEELNKLIGESSFSKEMKELSQYIGDFDFEAAKSPLKEIARKMRISLDGEKNE